MAFYRPDPAMGQRLEALVQQLEQQGRHGLADQLSITWVRYDQSLPEVALGAGRELSLGTPTAEPRGLGASWQGTRLRYPASVVKLVYLVAAEAWLQRQWLAEEPELRRALAAMIQHSSNDATSLVMDRLSGTTSGPDLPPEPLALWSRQRQQVNRWLQQLGWPELEGWNACQKTWEDGPYGRERQSYGPTGENRNRLNSDGVARLLEAVLAGDLLSPPACRRLQLLLQRPLDLAQRQADPENQVDGFLGEGAPDGARLWSKAGWMSQARHDAAYLEAPDTQPVLLVVFTEGPACAQDTTLLPALATALLQP